MWHLTTYHVNESVGPKKEPLLSDFTLQILECIDQDNYQKLELKPIVVAIQWALVRTYWIDEPLDW